MSHLSNLRAVVIGLAGFYVLSPVLGQSVESADKYPTAVPAENPAESRSATADPHTKAYAGRGAEAAGTVAQYVPALNGAGVLTVDAFTKPQLIFGYTAGAGWDSNPGQGTGKADASGLVTLNPYIGFEGSRGRTEYVLQYAPILTRYNSTQYGNRALHIASAALMGALNDRWRWTGTAKASYGQDSLRLFTPLSTAVTGGIVGAGRDAAAARAQAGTGLFLDSSLGLTYLKSERDAFDFSVGTNYSRFAVLGGSSSFLSARAGYSRRVSQTLRLLTYGQTLLGYGASPCTSLGGGVGASWQIREGTSLEVSGGPQFNIAQCSKWQSVAFNAAFSQQVSSHSRLYFRADRQFGTDYLGPGLWEDSIGGGYQLQMADGSIGADVGYTGSSGLSNGGDYHGVFIGGSYARQLNHGFNASVDYRRLASDTQQASFSRNVVLFSLTWNSSSNSITK